MTCECCDGYGYEDYPCETMVPDGDTMIAIEGMERVECPECVGRDICPQCGSPEGLDGVGDDYWCRECGWARNWETAPEHLAL